MDLRTDLLDLRTTQLLAKISELGKLAAAALGWAARVGTRVTGNVKGHAGNQNTWVTVPAESTGVRKHLQPL